MQAGKRWHKWASSRSQSVHKSSPNGEGDRKKEEKNTTDVEKSKISKVGT
jgi:hypothetical protein